METGNEMRDPPVLFVDTPTQELVVKIFTQKKEMNSYTRVRCEALDGFET